MEITVGRELLLLLVMAFIAIMWIHWRTATQSVWLVDKRNSLGLRDFVASLQTELEQMESERLAQQRGALFRVKDFDLELSFVLKHNEKDSTKVEYQILTAEMERELGREQTHKITLHMDLSPPTAFQVLPSARPLSTGDAIELPFVPNKK
jgi:K+ transporter